MDREELRDKSAIVPDDYLELLATKAEFIVLFKYSKVAPEYDACAKYFMDTDGCYVVANYFIDPAKHLQLPEEVGSVALFEMPYRLYKIHGNIGSLYNVACEGDLKLNDLFEAQKYLDCKALYA